METISDRNIQITNSMIKSTDIISIMTKFKKGKYIKKITNIYI